MENKIALINVVYENYSVLEDFLTSLRRQKNKNFHLFNIDLSIHRNKINDQGLSAETIYSTNKGYAYGVNIGLKIALNQDYKYICILNNDVFFKNDFIENCFRTLLAHPSSIIGGKIYYAPGYEYHKGKYSKKDLGNVIWYAGGKFDWNHAFTPHIGVDEIDSGQFDSFKEIDFVSGALMLLDKSTIEKIGFWDESYFLYYEDADFCARAKNLGVEIYYDPNIVIWHKVSQSTDGSGSQLHQKYQRKNRLKFGLKYAPLKTKLHLMKNYILGQ